MSDTVLVLRTCNEDLTSYKGFQWPESGYVEAPDWNPEPICGGGLHGLLWGAGDGEFLDWGTEAKWLVVEVDVDLIVTLETGDGVKFPRGKVVHCGNRETASTYLLDSPGMPLGTAVVGCTVLGWNEDQVIAGDYGMALTGERGHATAGIWGEALAGENGVVTVGKYGLASVGLGGKAAAGYKGAICIPYWNNDRYRYQIGYIGENGLEPNTFYQLDPKTHQFVAAGDQHP